MVKMKMDDTREKILGVADKLFSRFGYHRTSMDEIAKTSRKAKGSLYYHFDSKEELFREVVAQELTYLRKELNEILERNDISAAEKFRLYLLERMKVLSKSGNYHEMIKADFYEHFEFVDDVRKEHEQWEGAVLLELFKGALYSGEIVSDLSAEVMVDVFLMVERSLEVPLFVQDKYDDYEQYFENLSMMLMRGLGNSEQGIANKE